MVAAGSTTEPALLNDDRTGILGKPVREVSTMASTVATGNLILAYGDVRSAYVIVDRIGVQVELIQSLFGSTAGLPASVAFRRCVAPVPASRTSTRCAYYAFARSSGAAPQREQEAAGRRARERAHPRAGRLGYLMARDGRHHVPAGHSSRGGGGASDVRACRPAGRPEPAAADEPTPSPVPREPARNRKRAQGLEP
jgi:hypothetical protein